MFKNYVFTPIANVVLFALATSALAASDEHEHPMPTESPMSAMCEVPGSPLQNVADVDGSGIVDLHDLLMIWEGIESGNYAAIYDRNGDRAVGFDDLILAIADYGTQSPFEDQEIARFYHRFKHLQPLTDAYELRLMGYGPITSSLAGHGAHWGAEELVNAVLGSQPAVKHALEGLNVPDDESGVKALFWGQAATPLFEDAAADSGLSSLDWPEPNGEWMAKQVQAFDGDPPVFTSHSGERWHTHAGLCVTLQELGNGPQWVLDQHTSFAECQSIPDLSKTADDPVSFWGNFWMLHMWLFDPNPNGLFAGTHPCVDPDAPSEDEINRGRTVPEFFAHH